MVKKNQNKQSVRFLVNAHFEAIKNGNVFTKRIDFGDTIKVDKIERLKDDEYCSIFLSDGTVIHDIHFSTFEARFVNITVIEPFVIDEPVENTQEESDGQHDLIEAASDEPVIEGSTREPVAIEDVCEEIVPDVSG